MQWMGKEHQHLVLEIITWDRTVCRMRPDRMLFAGMARC